MPRRILRPILRRPTLRRACVVALVGASAFSLSVGTAMAAGEAGDGRIYNQLRLRFHPLTGLASGEVLDASGPSAGHLVWSSGAGEALMPASTTKIGTAIAALSVLGPNHTERTRALLEGHTLYLVGGADQHLTGDDLNALADATATALRARHLTGVTLYVDDSLFPHVQPVSPGWQPGYVPGEVSSISALQVFGHENVDSALYAGNVFRSRLGTHGIGVQGGVLGRAKAPRAATQLASHTSDSLASEVERMLKDSVNDNAEGFARLTALAVGQSADWKGATTAVRSVLNSRYHVPLTGVQLYDGSGLSRSDRMTAHALAYMAALTVNPRYSSVLQYVRAGFPVAGVDGTLGPSWGRFTTAPTNCAVGRIDAKTGTLTGAIALAGLALNKQDGQWKAFAFLEEGGFNTTSARDLIDRWATTVEGCW
ncbi:D-alanyl-D-alanine carboxypeptidase/D-alanyl-D-alanine endopeptidase [Streptacidiphilus jiangxiensis]|uniref:D-alanyl-D-alanine carboxypeptidase / D-alanyl-D-alanine-endopeptidase (Penicillin-binding protein 4) n=1 Tax=Streptacidiphilus jiangxiensis TaxID=235985 RepID=A0A1H7HVT9_STRJI|nr:D-alanyl-D-alanine carboxypeptidase/D-alanyl-D-alanine-endopeptidase [Streptacidiphilus jiangxiensis]SEK54391.1 D-alanyl-D-alanine carboxypeptidase / D-alanyl-D-alanine-endopeptidase (penicillin-binding protein 4) [Streptacidiphilus jiangxiensis]